ncbi:hypothetical protein Lal_00018643 [Lupinus albus]|nr:hypothetical protein Lal_00018643 [Lupinus albus]
MERASEIHSPPFLFMQSHLLHLTTHIQMYRFAYCSNPPLYKPHGHSERQETLESLECYLYSLHQIFDSARVKSWLWIKGQYEMDSIIYPDWIANPLTCLNIVL